MTEKEKMLAGEIYSAVDPQLIEDPSIATMASRLEWVSGSLPTSTSPYSTKPQSPSATTALSARM